MTIRHALFIDGAWADSGGDSWTALVTVDKTGIDIRPYSEAAISDVVRFYFEEFDAIAELVARLRDQEAQP
jgi:hypothetical protein